MCAEISHNRSKEKKRKGKVRRTLKENPMQHNEFKCNTIGLSPLFITTVLLPKLKSGERADVPKVELGEQRDIAVQCS